MEYTEEIRNGNIVNFRIIKPNEVEYLKVFCLMNEDNEKHPVLASYCKLHLGLYYLYYKKDDMNAYQKFVEAAQMGHVEAVRYLGELFMYGLNGQKNYESAYIFTNYAAKYGSIDALVNLGKMYECGLYVNKCIYKALKMYNWACSKSQNTNPRAVWHRNRLFEEHKQEYMNRYWS